MVRDCPFGFHGRGKGAIVDQAHQAWPSPSSPQPRTVRHVERKVLYRLVDLSLREQDAGLSEEETTRLDMLEDPRLRQGWLQLTHPTFSTFQALLSKAPDQARHGVRCQPSFQSEGRPPLIPHFWGTLCR